MDYNSLASEKSVQKTKDALTVKGYEVLLVKNGKEDLTNIQKIIPPHSSVINGSSVTFEQIGYVDYLTSNKHSWTDLGAQIRTENDNIKTAEFETPSSSFRLLSGKYPCSCGNRGVYHRK